MNKYRIKTPPQWNGPFVVVSSTPNGTYYLPTANSYHIKTQVNQAWLQRLNHSEMRCYTNDFWHVSARTRKLDQQVQQAQRDHEITATMLQNRSKA